MSEKKPSSRRTFLKSSLVVPAALSAIPVASASATPAVGDALPRRKLGRNGPDVTILNLGGMMSAHNPQYLDLAWRMGIRYFDTADCYKKGQSEEDIGKWLKRYPERRKELFLVTKDHPKNEPKELLKQIDERLKKLGTDYVDLIFIHGLSPKYGKDGVNWPKSDELRRVFDQIKASGKAKMCGFSCHDAQLIDILNNAAEGGFVDAIMLRYNPFFKKGDAFDRALDACYDKGIGLISMKEMKPIAKAPRLHPKLEGSGLSTHQNMLQLVWSDHRISSICSAMENVQQMEENTLAARQFKNPVSSDIRGALSEIAQLHTMMLCPGCLACSENAKKTAYAFHDISRYVLYYEQDGDAEARDQFHRLDEHERLPNGDVDLARLRDQCEFKVDYPEIARRAESYFG